MAAMIDKLVGHQSQKTWLLEQITQQSLPSSIIFQGPHGIGKKFLALAILQMINCEYAETACGECSNCHRVLEDQNDLVIILKPEGKKTIGVDQVREVQSALNLKTTKRARFVIIDPADKLTVQSSNALLKVLEESPERTHFILILEKMGGILPTIRSRSHIVKFNALTSEELGHYQNFSSLALNWSDGRLQMALDLEEPAKCDQLNESLQLLYSLLCESPQDWKKKAPWFFSNDENRDFTYSIWKQALAKRLHSQGENLDWLPENLEMVTKVYECFENLKKDIHSNVDKVLAMENFYYRVHSQESV